MKKPTLLVLRVPDDSEDQQRFKEGLALLEPYRMGISPQAEQSVVEYMSDRRYLGLTQETLKKVKESAELASKEAAGVDNRGIVAGLIAIGGVGLLVLLSNRMKLPVELVASGIGLIAALSLLIALPVLKKRDKDGA